MTKEERKEKEGEEFEYFLALAAFQLEGREGVRGMVDGGEAVRTSPDTYSVSVCLRPLPRPVVAPTHLLPVSIYFLFN